jgi:titin
LDNSPSNPYDFTLSIIDNSVLTASGASADMFVTQLIDGESYSGCTDVQIMPGDKALTLGEAYYARVLAYNSVGYSLPQVAPAAEKPMVVPGKPTSVVLTTVSKCDLRVTFNPPDSDGGDTITEYLIEYSVNSDFSDAEETSLKFLEGGAPYHKTISGLIQGTFYFVRVSAKNSQDYGAAAISTPASLQPYEASSAPTNVYLRQTSNSMLTVSFFEPLDNGGDEVKSYIVEWDTSSGFNGVVTKPHKDSVELNAAEYNSYTIPYLTEGTSYYVRVFAVNSAGESVPAASNPTHYAPMAKVPGKPHTITAVGGVSSGTIVVTWQRPRVPWHEIPCSGTLELPDDCPTAIGGGLPVSNGGSDISSYLIEYNDKKDFTGKDKGKHSTVASTFTIQDLTPGRQYYMRVLAVNENGPGNFCSNTDPNCLITSSATVITATATVV